MTWHYAKDGRPAGPIAHDEMLRLIETEGIGPDDLVWSEGMAAWERARGVPGLFAPPTSDAPAGGPPPFPPQLLSYSAPLASTVHPGAGGSPAAVAAPVAVDFPPGFNEQGFFSVEGRAGRMRYFLQTLVPGGLAFVLLTSMTLTTESSPFSFVLLLALGGIWAFPAVRRLHDLDLPGWLFVLAFVPLIGFFLGIPLLFVRGTPGPNDYGPDPLDDAYRAPPAARGRACPSCGAFVPTDARFCSSCRAQVR